MTGKKFPGSLALALVAAFFGPPPLAAEALNIFAAASLRGALDEVAATYTDPVRISYGGSSAMARQVAQGAPADIVILANPIWDTWLSERLTDATAATPVLLTNSLVLIGPLGSAPFETRPEAADIMARLGKDARLAMGEDRSVPAGQYARQWLVSRDMWDLVEPRLAETQNVRGALALVDRAEVPLGIVYGSDALASNRAVILWEIDPETHSPIRYPARALSDAGARFLDHAKSPKAQDIFARHGFGPGLPK